MSVCQTNSQIESFHFFFILQKNNHMKFIKGNYTQGMEILNCFQLSLIQHN